MAAHGGARPGAGRKRKTDKYLGQIVEAEDRIADRLPQLIDNLIALADGVEVQEDMPNGGTRIYSRAPDYKANEYLINRVMGKPTERVEHTGEDGGAMAVTSPSLERAASELDRWRNLMTERLTRETAETTETIADPSSSPSAP